MCYLLLVRVLTITKMFLKWHQIMYFFLHICCLPLHLLLGFYLYMLKLCDIITKRVISSKHSKNTLELHHIILITKWYWVLPNFNSHFTNRNKMSAFILKLKVWKCRPVIQNLPATKYLDMLERNHKHGVYELVRVCENVKEIPKGSKMKKIYPYNCLGK